MTTGTRHTRFEYDLLDRDENELGALDIRPGGALTYSAQASIKSGGQLPAVGVDQVDSWLNKRIRVTIDTGGQTWPLGVFIPDGETTNHSPFGRVGDLRLLDKLTVLDGDSFLDTYGVQTGATVTTVVQDIIESTGLHPGAITESAEKLRTGIEFDEKDSKLAIINQLLEAANFFSLWTDGSGRFQVTPYKEPQRRGVVHVFESGRNCIHSPEFVHAHAVGEIPNRFIAVSKADGDTVALRAEAVNENPDSDYSFDNLGFWRTSRDDDVDTTSQSSLQAHANRRLQELSSKNSTYEITHAPIKLRVNDVVRFVSQPHGVNILATVQRIEWPLTFDGLCRTTLREVVDL